MKPRPSIQARIAKLCGVAQSTVSRILRGGEARLARQVEAVARTRNVLDVARRLGYATCPTCGGPRRRSRKGRS